MGLLRLIIFLSRWIKRLPKLFTISFVALMLLFLLLLIQIVETIGPEGVRDLAQLVLVLGFGFDPDEIETRGLKILANLFIDGTFVTAILIICVLLSYNGAAWLHRKLRWRPRVYVHPPELPTPGKGHRLDKFKKIGIILAGGGAKGAYQAGALKAIYEFLEENNALEKVKMVAGTSIGSWNGMFWLAGLVKPPPSGQSAHEAWWKSVNVKRIVEMANYWPLRRNYFLLTTPWQEAFDRLFVENEEVAKRLQSLISAPDSNEDAAIHFYFTRSNVERGHLEFTTNWPGISNLTRPNLRTCNPDDVEPVVSSDRYLKIVRREDTLAMIKQAVFTSMDLPPLFPYQVIVGHKPEWFEDGGVVDNLPVWFGTQLERCDLLFVLPLNASFAERANQTSITHRLFRVMDVRQGVLEMNSMKLARVYNELGWAWNQVQNIPDAAVKIAQLRKEHKLVSVFAICPEQPLAIGTAEFWKTRQAGEAFDLMYAETKAELTDRFEDHTDPNWIRMTLVDPQGERSWRDDF